MHLSFGAVLLLLGLLLIFASQLMLAIHAFATRPLAGLACLFVPFYIYVYARRNKVGRWLMGAWYGGIALWIAGGVMLS